MIHLTLNTGHTRQSPRAEVADEIITALKPLVTAGGGPVPGIPPYTVTITRDTGCAAYTIAHPEYGPLITGVICHDPASRDYAWHGAEQLYHTTTEDALRAGTPLSAPVMALPPCPQSEPWLAVIIIPIAYHIPTNFMVWAGDLERCLAWTILDLDC